MYLIEPVTIKISLFQNIVKWQLRLHLLHSTVGFCLKVGTPSTIYNDQTPFAAVMKSGTVYKKKLRSIFDDDDEQDDSM